LILLKQRGEHCPFGQAVRAGEEGTFKVSAQVKQNPLSSAFKQLGSITWQEKPVEDRTPVVQLMHFPFGA
jgi:hypothetical protein